MARGAYSRLICFCALALFAGVVRADIAYEEEVRFASPEGTVTNRFSIHVGEAGVRVDDAQGRTLVFRVDAGQLQVLDRKGDTVSDLSTFARETRFVQLRESMERLATVLGHLPPEKAAPLRDELAELRRGLRDMMRGVLPWSPCASSVSDPAQWVEAEEPVTRHRLTCRRYLRAPEGGSSRREFLLASWEDIEIERAALDPVREMERAWMEALAGKDESVGDHPPIDRATLDGFLFEERDLYGDRVLWEVYRTAPRNVVGDPARYRLPPRSARP